MRPSFSRLHFLGGLFLLALLCAALAGPKYFQMDAATLIVTNTNDSGLGSLRQALADVPDGGTIQFNPALNGQTVTLTSAELVISKSITISGPGPGFLRVSRDQQATNFRILHLLPNHTVEISGLTISNGQLQNGNGGGILNDHATLTINNCTISGNVVTSKSPTQAGGGGIYNSGTLSLVNSTVSGNSSRDLWSYGGGGIWNTGILTITQSSIDGNSGDTTGGGILNGGILMISNSTVASNHTNVLFGHFGGNGGGIANSGNATLTIQNTTISGNATLGGDTFHGYGGGIYGGATITNSTIRNNTAYRGGGIYGGGTISNSTISDNSADATGGGIHGGGAITDSTFSGNRAGGIYATSAVNLGNTTLKAGPSGANIVNSGGSVTSLGYNLSSDNGGGFLTGPGDQINTDPLLGPLQNNGGPTFTHELLTGSPAINAGDPNFTPPPFHDQRDFGYLRVYNGRIDIGSFEAQPLPTVSPTPTATATATATATPTPFVTPCANAFVFGEGFDGVTAPALPAGWSAANAAGAAPLWVTSTVMPDTAPNDAFIDDPATVSDKHLDTPEIPISGQGAQVFFRNFYDLQSSSTPGVGFDGGVLEVSIDGGAFTDITAVGGSFVTGGYNRTISTAFMSPIAGRMAWSGNSGGYINTVANLGPSVVGHFIKLRFRMASDNNVSATGWRVDNVGMAVICQPPSPTPTPSCPPITQSTTQTITTENSISCNNGVGQTDNSYWRAFNMGTFVGGAQYNVTSVSFGVESANQTQPVTVRLYTNSGGAFPGGTRTQIATTTIDVTSAQSGTVVPTPLTATAPAGTSELVMELFTPNGKVSGNLFLVGSNVDPQTGPSYLSAGDCGITIPTDTATLGFPNMHIVFTINGSCTGGTPTPTPTATATATATATSSPTATATATATVPGGTPTPTLTPTATPSATPPAQALNLSTRLQAQGGANVGIGGIIITGTSPKRVLFRGIGPFLAGFGVPGALANPIMELHGPLGFATMTNDNWRDTQETEIKATGIPPTNDLESAIVVTLGIGPYTAIVRGQDDTSGVALIEAYDLDQAADSKMSNISTRAFVSTGSNVVIAGFILGGNSGDDNVIVRGIGPSLTGIGVPDALADPTLELRNSNGVLLRANDNWQDDPAQAAIISAAGLAPANPLESGIAETLPPGQYTALLAGLNNGTGVGLVEVYDRGTP